MNLGSFETAANQAANTAKNAAKNAAAGIRRETSITGRASALLGRAAEAGRGAEKPRRTKTGVYVLSEEAARAGAAGGDEVFVAEDGYVRKTPIQPLVVSPSYKKKIIAKAVGAFIVAAVAVLVVYALSRLGVLGV